jgi:hypothetical protein
MSMTLDEFIHHMANEHPNSQTARAATARKMGEAMFELAETDEGMRDLLDRATEYYLLKTEK